MQSPDVAATRRIGRLTQAEFLGGGLLAADCRNGCDLMINK